MHGCVVPLQTSTVPSRMRLMEFSVGRCTGRQKQLMRPVELTRYGLAAFYMITLYVIKQQILRCRSI
jgi:hypothetical protein